MTAELADMCTAEVLFGCCKMRTNVQM